MYSMFIADVSSSLNIGLTFDVFNVMFNMHCVVLVSTLNTNWFIVSLQLH